MLAVLLVLSTALAGCGFVGARPASVASMPGFFVGIWDGLIAPWTLLLRAFLDIRMYAVPNSGWWYDARGSCSALRDRCLWDGSPR
jgi:hypothetical protein